MENIVLAVHLLTALAIIGLIMIQQGKGADMGASFGAGASQTLFGAAGSGNFFSRVTGILAAVFFVTSFTLAYLAKQKTEVDDIPLPSLEIEAPAVESEIPALESEAVEGEIPSVESAEAEVEAAAEGEIPAAAEEAVEEVKDELPAVPVE